MRWLLCPLILFALAGCASLEPSPNASRAVVAVDPAKFYVGTWYEIGRRPMVLTNGCVAGGTTYTPKGGDAVQVLDYCHQGAPDGPLKTIGGPARITDPGANAKLRVHYRLFGFIPIVRQYWVLARADDYSWFISADPTFHDLWIYTRDPQPSPTLVSDLVGRARTLGYPTERLEFPATSSGSGAPSAPQRQ